MYIITEKQINSKIYGIKLIGTLYTSSKVLYIYIVLSKNNHRFLHSSTNKHLYNNINDVIMFLIQNKGEQL